MLLCEVLQRLMSMGHFCCYLLLLLLLLLQAMSPPLLLLLLLLGYIHLHLY
jgi:hypothetical protein